MRGEWIGHRWCGYTGEPECDRLLRKQALLLDRMMRNRTASGVRLFCAYRDAAEIVGARIAEMPTERLAA